MFHQKFRVPEGKLAGWKRLMGQEIPIVGYTDATSIAGTSVFPATHVGLTQNVGGAAAPVSPVNASVTTREMKEICSGPQTPKASQGALDMWIPLLNYQIGSV